MCFTLHVVHTKATMDFAYWCVIGLLIVFLNTCLTRGHFHGHVTGAAGVTQYSREFLLLLRDHTSSDHKLIIDSLPNYLRRNPKKWTIRTRHKRGSKGGIRQKLRRLRNKLPLPITLLINAQSLRAKTEELTANTRYLNEYRSACILAITETWLDSNVSDSEVGPRGFSVLRTDRDPSTTGKIRGGGVCLLIRDEWCKTVVVRESLCTPDIELLCVSLRPPYLPREFPQIFYTVAYIHPKANADRALDAIFNLTQKLDALSPDAPKFILGDFNNCPLKKCLRTYYQYVDCPSRKNAFLDLCYGTVKNAYRSSLLPPLGASDHKVVYLRPVYQRVFEREKPQTKILKTWVNDSIMFLQGCFECTNWEIFNCDDINEQVEVISDYINFCTDSIIPTKVRKVFPNDKPWVSNKLKHLIMEKKKAYWAHDDIGQRNIQRQIKRQIQLDKYSYRKKIEATLVSGNSREAWQGIKTMTDVPHKGRGKPSLDWKHCLDMLGGEDIDSANQLNNFFCRFESDRNDTVDPPSLSPPPSASEWNIRQSDVLQIF
ncbi:uncharacterized protein PAE49_021521 [Odontesthes bonariensis]